MQAFKSILSFQKHFGTEKKCREYLELQRWNGTPACPHCASINNTRLKGGKRFQCNEKECRGKFSVTVGTVFENTKIPLTKWFLAMYILANHSKGISSTQLANWLDVTQTTAWFLNHRIREMLGEKSDALLSGIVEVDETYYGGKEKNKHVSKRKSKGGVDGKTMVIGAIERGGKSIRTKIIEKTNIEQVTEFIRENIEPNSTMVTDEHKAYKRVKNEYNHETVSHGKDEYVRKDNKNIHTNSIEGFWSVLKRQINGIHHFVTPKHLQRYCNEASYRYVNRGLAQDERFADALSRCNGRLKYNDLIGKDATQ